MSRLIEKIKENKVKTLIIVAAIFTVITMSGTTYALYAHNDLGNNTNYTAGLLDLTITEVSPLTLSNALPMPDTDGEASTPCTITITNTGNITQKFNILLENTTTSNSINTNYIKIKVDDDNARVLGSNNVLKSSITLAPTESITINIRLWLSLDTPTSEKNKTFTAKIKTVGKGVKNVPYLSKKLINLALGTHTTSEIPLQSGEENSMENGDFIIVHHPSTEQVTHDTYSYRYKGASPNNYISFNGETWRIIGVTEEYTGSSYEYVTKIIKTESYNNTTHSWGHYDNEWSTSSLNTTLNSTYYGTLSSAVKGQIQSVKWYLGGNDCNKTKCFYNEQRGTTGYSGRSTNWTGNIALMYAEDYGYAAGKTCVDQIYLAGVDWDVVDYSWGYEGDVVCKNIDWLFKSEYQWTLSPVSGNQEGVRFITSSGSIYTMESCIDNDARPTLFLKSSIIITGGTGTSTDPYTIS